MHDTKLQNRIENQLTKKQVSIYNICRVALIVQDKNYLA